MASKLIPKESPHLGLVREAAGEQESVFYQGLAFGVHRRDLRQPQTITRALRKQPPSATVTGRLSRGEKVPGRRPASDGMVREGFPEEVPFEHRPEDDGAYRVLI